MRAEPAEGPLEVVRPVGRDEDDRGQAGRRLVEPRRDVPRGRRSERAAVLDGPAARAGDEGEVGAAVDDRPAGGLDLAAKRSAVAQSRSARAASASCAADRTSSGMRCGSPGQDSGR